MKRLLLFLLTSTFTLPLMAQEPPEGNEWGFIEANHIHHIPEYGGGSQLGAIYAVSPDTVYLTAKQGVFYKSTDGGQSWEMTDSHTNEDLVDLKFYNSVIGIAVGLNGVIAKTDNGGITWTTISPGTAHDLASVCINALDDIWAVGDAGLILHSTDAGDTWVADTTQTNVQLNSVAFRNDSVGFISGNDGVLLKTINGGQTWDMISLATQNDLFSLSTTAHSVYMLQGSASNYQYMADSLLYRTDTTTWEPRYLNSSGEGASALQFVNDTTGYCISGGAALCDCCVASIYRTTANLQTWTKVFYYESTADPCVYNLGFSDMSLIDSTGYAFLGNYILKLHGGILKSEKFVKDEFKIYPNPAKTRITIALKNVDPSELTVQFFDMQGEQVSITEGLNKQKTFDISDLAPGVYFVKLSKYGKVFGVKKMIKQ